MEIKVHPYVQVLKTELSENADEAKAVQMERYMKNKFDFFGIKAPERKEIFKKFWKEKGVPEGETLKDVVINCFLLPQREFQYFAMETFDKRVQKAKQDGIDIIEHMILNKSWWDTVDFVAANSAGTFFKKYPDLIETITGRWIESDSIWLKRSAILFQLKYKKETDTDLLFTYIKKIAGSKEFFLQKGIGWCLREYSKTNPEAVMEFIEANELAPLSKREGMKIINKGMSHG